MNTENKLKKLFDYQKFENNERLEQVIEKSSAGCQVLSDEELSEVAGGGHWFDSLTLLWLLDGGESSFNYTNCYYYTNPCGVNLEGICNCFNGNDSICQECPGSEPYQLTNH